MGQGDRAWRGPWPRHPTANDTAAGCPRAPWPQHPRLPPIPSTPHCRYRHPGALDTTTNARRLAHLPH
eukprot:9900260-Lingulodinium_polyedra.AAC.1